MFQYLSVFSRIYFYIFWFINLASARDKTYANHNSYHTGIIKKNLYFNDTVKDTVRVVKSTVLTECKTKSLVLQFSFKIRTTFPKIVFEYNLVATGIENPSSLGVL